ncbi:MAG: pyridoxamine 5'-phosphate oxidase family protein [Tannerellaceae bacterium]|nr:pyridoxamine 5'-phosphate oxidase family protein [Tannerellaceae bacterium]
MKRVINLLKKQAVAVLATSADDRPRASVIEQYVLEGEAILFGTDPRSIKGQKLAKNPRISLSVMTETEMVTADGAVATPSEAEEKAYLNELYTRHPEFKDMPNDETVCYKIIIDTAYYSDFSSGQMDAEVINNP